MPNNHLDFGVDLLPVTTDTYNLGTPEKKWNIYGTLKSDNIVPIASKTYSAYTCSADSQAKAVLFFGKINITNSSPWQTPWSIHYRVYVSTTENNTQGWYDCNFSVVGSTVMYYNYNNFYSTDYRPIYHHSLLFPKSGYSSYGGFFGVRVQTSRTVTSLARTFKIEIIETNNCTVDIFDSIKRFDETYITTNSVAASTIWNYGEYTGTAQGLYESGDSNDGCYYVRYWTLKAESAITGGNIIVGTSAGYKHLKLGTAFDLSYPPLYAGSNISAGSTSNNNYLFHYAIGTGTTQSGNFTAYLPIYIKGTISGNTFTPVSTTPLTQTLSNSDDGYVYYYIGHAYAATSMTFDATAQKILWYKNGSIQEWSGASAYAVNAGNAAKVNGLTVQTAVPQNALFTDKYHKTGSWNGLTYTATAVNSADALAFTIPTGTTTTTVAVGNHTHDLSIAADTGTNALTFAANSKYKLTAGGKTYIFTTQNDATYLKNIGRLTEMNIDLGSTTYNSKLFISYADGSTTGHKPYQNAMVLNIAWDNLNSNKYGAQIAIGNTTTPHLQLRGCNNGTWDDNWLTVLDSDNTYAANANGNAVTVTCGTAATLATIKGVAVKINVTKPSYNWSDIGSKPALNKLSIVKNNAATFYLMGTTTTISDTASDITAVASTAMTYNGADKGTARITLGTATATSSTGGHFGELFLYSTGTNGTSIKSAANSTAAYVATLQAATGTIAYTADITTAIQALDVAEKTNTASQTIDKISEADGKISVTFKDISITKSQVSDFPTTMTPSSHSHGNITNTGTIGTAGKKKLVIVGTDNKVTTGAEIGSTTTTFLNNAGNWGTPANNAVTHTLKNTAKFYVTGTESATGSTGGDTFDDGVYVTATSGQLNATSYLVATHVMLTYNTTDQSLDFSFV